jgi:hypothetical protein
LLCYLFTTYQLFQLQIFFYLIRFSITLSTCQRSSCPLITDIAAAANAVHSSIATPKLPAILEPFKFVAPWFIKGGGYQTINLVKRPVLPAQLDEQSEAILAI